MFEVTYWTDVQDKDYHTVVFSNGQIVRVHPCSCIRLETQEEVDRFIEQLPDGTIWLVYEEE